MLNIIFTCALSLFVMNVEAKLTSVKRLNDSGLKEIQKAVDNFSEDNHLGMSFIVTNSGKYSDATELNPDSISKYLNDAEILHRDEEDSKQKVAKFKVIAKEASSIKLAVEKTFAVLQEIIERNKEPGFKPDLETNSEKLLNEVKSKSIAWALSKDNKNASMIRTKVSIDADAYNADGKWYRALDGELLIYVQPESKEFLILLMGVEHD